MYINIKGLLVVCSFKENKIVFIPYMLRCVQCNSAAMYNICDKYEICKIPVCKEHCDDIISKKFMNKTIKVIKII